MTRSLDCLTIEFLPSCAESDNEMVTRKVVLSLEICETVTMSCQSQS